MTCPSPTATLLGLCKFFTKACNRSLRGSAKKGTGNPWFVIVNISDRIVNLYIILDINIGYVYKYKYIYYNVWIYIIQYTYIYIYYTMCMYVYIYSIYIFINLGEPRMVTNSFISLRRMPPWSPERQGTNPFQKLSYQRCHRNRPSSTFSGQNRARGSPTESILSFFWKFSNLDL